MLIKVWTSNDDCLTAKSDQWWQIKVLDLIDWEILGSDWVVWQHLPNVSFYLWIDDIFVKYILPAAMMQNLFKSFLNQVSLVS